MTTHDDNAPMHPSLKARVLEAAMKYKSDSQALERAARALVLCPPDCEARDVRRPEQHAHTYWDMIRMAGELDYGWKCRKAAEAADDAQRMDTTSHLRRAGVGEVHVRGMTHLEGSRAAVRAVRKWLGQARPIVGDGQPGPMPFPWLVLLGQTGAGKTQAAVVALEHFIRRYPWNTQAGGAGAGAPPFVVAHVSEVVQLARDEARFESAGVARERLEHMRRARVLVLDDLGAERLDANALGLLHSLANARYERRMVTILTANVNAKDFEARFDFNQDKSAEHGQQQGRLWRRVRELGAVVQLGKTAAKMKMGESEVALD
jgi:hypothetical protein